MMWKLSRVPARAASRRPPLLGVVGLSAALVLGAASVPASARNVPTEPGVLHFSGEVQSYLTCPTEITSEYESPDQAITENGGPVRGTSRRTSAHRDVGQVVAWAASEASMQAQVTSGEGLRKVSFEGDGYAAFQTANPESPCAPVTSSVAEASASLTFEEPTLARFELEGEGRLISQLVLRDNDGMGVGLGSSIPAHQGEQTVFLNPGTYEIYGYLNAYLEASTPQIRSGSVSATVSFMPPGSKATEVSGGGKRFVSLPLSRSCSNRRILTSVTENAKRAAKIQRVEFRVNGVRVKALAGKRIKRGRTVQLKVADAARAEVQAWITLRPKKKGSSPRVKLTRATYEPCTAPLVGELR